MLLLCHGGKCCGIKHIYGFDMHPTIGLLPSIAETGSYLGARGQQDSPGQVFFCAEAPEENALSRFERYLDFLKEKTPGCLVQVTLILMQKSMWESILLEHGFRLVDQFKNSNTPNTIFVYHRIMVGGE